MTRRWKVLGGSAGFGALMVAVIATTLICQAGEVSAPATDEESSPATAIRYSQTGDAWSLEQSIVSAAESTSRSVVALEVQVSAEMALQRMMPFGNPFEDMPDPFFFFDPDNMGPGAPGEGEGEEAPERLVPQGGTGVIHSADGHIVTNHHVVEDAVEIRVTLHDGQTYEATVVGSDEESDLAVIKIDAEGLTPASYADMDEVKPGMFAIAVGMPLGLDYSVTVGHVSALGRGNLYPTDLLMQMQRQSTSRLSIQNFIQTDASINPGNSGGPLVNLAGEVMGINTIVQGGVGGGFGFAIPSDMVQRVAEQLVSSGKVSRAWLGISMTDLTYEKAQALEVGRNHGALVEEVFDDSPAKAAGLKRGDVIVAVDGDEVQDSKDVVYRVGRPPGRRRAERHLRAQRQGEDQAGRDRRAPRGPEPGVGAGSGRGGGRGRGRRGQPVWDAAVRAHRGAQPAAGPGGRRQRRAGGPGDPLGASPPGGHPRRRRADRRGRLGGEQPRPGGPRPGEGQEGVRAGDRRTGRPAALRGPQAARGRVGSPWTSRPGGVMSTRRTFPSLLLSTLLLSLAAAPAAAWPGGDKRSSCPEDIEDDSPVVARFAGGELTRAEVEAFLVAMNDRQRTRFKTSEGRRDMVERLVLNKALAEQARAAGVGDTLLDQIAMVQAMETYLVNRLMVELRAESASPEAARAYYDAHIDEYLKEQVSARHILIKDENGAWSAYERLMAGADFAELAKEVSEDRASKVKGGDLGWFGRGRMTPEFEEKVFSMALGGVSEPLKTRFGWHLIKLDGKRDVIPYEEVEARIERTLEREGITGYMDEVKAGLGVQIDDAALSQIDVDGL